MTAMAVSAILAQAIGASHGVMAATHGASSANEKNRQESACKADIQRFCSEANLKQECLVARWDRISAGCRNVLGSSSGDHPGGS